MEIFQVTFEQAAVGIAHVNLDGSFIRINQKFLEIVKYSREEMLTMTFRDITHKDDIEKDLEHADAMLQGAIDTYSTEKRYYCKDNSLIWIHLTVSLVRTQSGDPKYFISFIVIYLLIALILACSPEAKQKYLFTSGSRSLT